MQRSLIYPVQLNKRLKILRYLLDFQKQNLFWILILLAEITPAYTNMHSFERRFNETNNYLDSSIISMRCTRSVFKRGCFYMGCMPNWVKVTLVTELFPSSIWPFKMSCLPLRLEGCQLWDNLMTLSKVDTRYCTVDTVYATQY